MSVMQNDKLDALIMLSTSDLVQKNSEELQNVSCDIAVPSSLDKKVAKVVRKWQRDKTHSGVTIFLKRSCVAVLIACTILFTLVMSIAAVRDALWNMVTEWFDKYVEIGYQTQSLTPTTIEEKKEPSWLPHEYEKKVMTDGISAYVVRYILDEGAMLTYKQFTMESSYSIDSEGAEFYNVQVGTSEGMHVIYAEGHKALEWSDGQYIFSITSRDINMKLETMIRIAESVK